MSEQIELAIKKLIELLSDRPGEDYSEEYKAKIQKILEDLINSSK